MDLVTHGVIACVWQRDRQRVVLQVCCCRPLHYTCSEAEHLTYACEAEHLTYDGLDVIVFVLMSGLECE